VDWKAKNGWIVTQISALGRRPTGSFYHRDNKAGAERACERLNNASTGERYEVEWHIGVPRDKAEDGSTGDYLANLFHHKH
jgi:hypothetical protein